MMTILKANLLDKLWSALTGHSPHLLDLSLVPLTCSIVNYTYLGLRQVPLAQIRGSASATRCDDSDANFRLLKAHDQDRWQEVYAARQRGVKLPPVTLIQVGEIYFVEDGHHRLSVARARGEQTIEAEVTVWEVSGSLPWEQENGQ
jgi:hypothetical protein